MFALVYYSLIRVVTRQVASGRVNPVSYIGLLDSIYVLDSQLSIYSRIAILGEGELANLEGEILCLK